MSTIKHKIFGQNTKPTIYYLTGYGGSIQQFTPHIRVLARAGFRVVAFEYDKLVLNSGNPQTLIDALDDVLKFINQDKKRRKVAGVYGISLGSWLGLNILISCDISRGMFNTAAVSLTNLVWHNPVFAAAKAAFQQKGYTLESLRQAWHEYDWAWDGRQLKGKQVVILASSGDDVLDINEVSANVKNWQKHNIDVQSIVAPRLKHGHAIVRHMLRIRRTVKFFKS